jgi:hypothetical protein
MAALGGVVTGFRNALATALLPTLNALADEMLRTAKSSDAFEKATRTAATGLKLLLTTAELGRAIFANLGTGIGAVAAAVVSAASGNFRQAAEIIKLGFEDIQAAGQASATRILDIWQSLEGLEPPEIKAPSFSAGTEVIAPKTDKAKTELWVLTDEVILQQRAWMELGATAQESMDTVIESVSRANEDAIQNISGPIKAAASEWTVYAEQAARNMQDAFADFLFDPFKDGLRGMLAGFIDVIRQMVAELAASQIFKYLGGALQGSSNPMLAGLGAFLGGKAAGGPVIGGGAYLVGEKGPELFMPRSSGTIIPTGGFGGGVNVSYSIDARGADAERIMAILPAMLRQTEQRTVATVLQMQRQGRLA